MGIIVVENIKEHFIPFEEALVLNGISRIII